MQVSISINKKGYKDNSNTYQSYSGKLEVLSLTHERNLKESQGPVNLKARFVCLCVCVLPYLESLSNWKWKPPQEEEEKGRTWQNISHGPAKQQRLRQVSGFCLDFFMQCNLKPM